MSPKRRGGRDGSDTGGRPQPRDRHEGADLDSLRARLVEAERTARGAKKAQAKKPGTRRRVVVPDEPFDESLDEPFDEERRVREDHLRGEDASGEHRSQGHRPQGHRPQAGWWEQEAVRPPRPVVGGLSARTRTGPIGATWWSRRFLGSLESVMVGGRMARGRAYARRGQVVDLRIGPGHVAATVQGSRDEPYGVHLKMPVVPDEDWDRIVAALAARAGYAARMLAGDLPHEIEDVFESEGASLLPAPHARLVSECTCPDWENPCKHIAAVCYLLAEEFDRDPFALLAWRGRGRDEVLGELRLLRRQGAGPAPGSDENARLDTMGDASTAEGRGEGVDGDGADGEGVDGDRDLLEQFWLAGPSLAHVHVLPEEAPAPAAVLRLAARGAISVRGGDLVEVLASDYRAFAAAAAARARS